jgi:hypothetical protein
MLISGQHGFIHISAPTHIQLLLLLAYSSPS